MVLVTVLAGASGAPAKNQGRAGAEKSPTLPNAAAAGVPIVDPRVLPVRIVIPAIAVSAELERLHRSADGRLQTPVDWGNAGWYADGVVPGNRGPAVIVGHVDSARDGPAVFYRLAQLRRGDSVLVENRGGHSERFLVDAARQFPKSEFPTDLVYGPTPLSELRLITCAGAFDRSSGSYTDNLIVTAYSAATPQL